ncbi:response regulator [Paraburkholderia sp. J76]|uniref:response regulator n=1 Tax=Paraburkholderia sp. J76 TaxID=2805439 RepID=UPI002ABE31C6|nr:response regulator [Paraburkholderia sp. J76]
MTTIVVVDDETLITDFLTFFLEDAGYIVHAAHNGADALELIRQVSPALVITDYMMPRMTGLELALAMKADPVIQRIPVILSSAAQGASARANPELFAAVLDKPYPVEALLETLAGLIDAASPGNRQ